MVLWLSFGVFLAVSVRVGGNGIFDETHGSKSNPA
jgi:hypothetical protein